MATLSVLLPTLNCRHLLPAHVETMRPWLHKVDEIVVVDSQSSDGTLEYLRQAFSGLNASFHTQPRGLYQSWNFGIQQATGKWLYISTVGDSISLELMEQLLKLGENNQADAILSSPSYAFDEGCTPHNVTWAIHKILAMASPAIDFKLTSAGAHAFAFLNAHKSALLGSLASDLIRTAHFQTHPFPTEYGTSGDCAWGIMHAHQTNFVCTTRSGSIFRFHQKAYDPSTYHINGLSAKLDQLACDTNRQQEKPLGIADFQLEKFVNLDVILKHQYEELIKARKSTRYWFLHPHIWKLRNGYRRNTALFRMLKQNIVESIKAKHIVPISDVMA